MQRIPSIITSALMLHTMTRVMKFTGYKFPVGRTDSRMVAPGLCVHMYVYVRVYMCVYVCTCVFVCVWVSALQLSRYIDISRYYFNIEIKITGFIIAIIVNFWILLHTMPNTTVLVILQ